MAEASTEVRLCPKCAQSAVVLVNDWKHSTNGIVSGESTKDFRCQSCGSWFIKPPRSRVIAFWILGVIFVIPCGFGGIFMYLAWRWQNFDRRVQVVQGAPVPALRFSGGPPARLCAKCGKEAHAKRITRHSHNGIPTGTDYGYDCSGCGLSFETENLLGHFFSGLSALALLAVSAAFFFGATHPGWKYGGGLVCLAIGGLLTWQGAEKVLNRFKHKEVAAPPRAFT